MNREKLKELKKDCERQHMLSSIKALIDAILEEEDKRLPEIRPQAGELWEWEGCIHYIRDINGKLEAECKDGSFKIIDIIYGHPIVHGERRWKRIYPPVNESNICPICNKEE